MLEFTREAKLDLTRKYVQGLEAIWKQLVDEGPEVGNPLALFDEAIKKTEAALESLLEG